MLDGGIWKRSFEKLLPIQSHMLTLNTRTLSLIKGKGFGNPIMQNICYNKLLIYVGRYLSYKTAIGTNKRGKEKWKVLGSQNFCIIWAQCFDGFLFCLVQLHRVLFLTPDCGARLIYSHAAHGNDLICICGKVMLGSQSDAILALFPPPLFFSKEVCKRVLRCLWKQMEAKGWSWLIIRHDKFPVEHQQMLHRSPCLYTFV